MEIQFQTQTSNKRLESDYYVEGYATTFSPYVLFHDGEDEVYEKIEPTAFAGAKMDDVIFQFDHQGRIYARMSNGTLGLEVNEKGLLIWADLSKTENARRLYEEIKAGMITKMSWAFTVAPNGETYDSLTRTIHINKVREVFDVSAVSIPANDQTSIGARSKEAIKNMIQEQHDKETNKRKRLDLLLMIGGN